MKLYIISALFLLFSSLSVCAQNCADLWVARNQIFDNNGYCFKSNLGKSFFDNSDCYTSNAQLSRSEKEQVQRIKAQEKSLGCNIDTSQYYQGNSANNSRNVTSKSQRERDIETCIDNSAHSGSGNIFALAQCGANLSCRRKFFRSICETTN